MDDPLFCLVCGFERGGTTLAAELIRQHPRIDGRFECGFLLVDDMADFAEMEAYSHNLKVAWGLSQEDFEYILQSSTHQEAYRRLLERSNLPDKTVQIYDKTPRYMKDLPRVMQKVDVPVVCMVRDPRALFWSWRKRWTDDDTMLGGLKKIYHKVMQVRLPGFLRTFLQRLFYLHRINVFSSFYAEYAHAYQAAMERYPERILLVQYESLCLHPQAETRRIYDFLGLEYKDEYLAMPTVPDPYVDRGGILTDLIYEYRQGISWWEEKFILWKTRRFAQWHWRE